VLDRTECSGSARCRSKGVVVGGVGGVVGVVVGVEVVVVGSESEWC
jgi:hypothetical protein